MWSAYLIFIATIFDFSDGLAARALKVQSELGKQLDSLADMVTFGVAPGILIFYLLSHPDLQPHFWPMNIGYDSTLPSSWTTYASEQEPWFLVHKHGPYLALIIPVFSALRLAKFNIDESQTTEFKGLATPANALFFAGLCIFFVDALTLNLDGIGTWGLNKTIHTNDIGLEFVVYMIGLCIIMSAMLVMPIRMFSFKFKSMKWKGNEIRYAFILIMLLVISVCWAAEHPFFSAPIVVFLYIISSIINNLFTKKHPAT